MHHADSLVHAETQDGTRSTPAKVALNATVPPRLSDCFVSLGSMLSCSSAPALANVACPRTGKSGRSLDSRTSNIWGYLQSPGCRSVTGSATDNARTLRGFTLWVN